MVIPLVRFVWALLACTNTFKNISWKAAPVGGEAAAVHNPWPAIVNRNTNSEALQYRALTPVQGHQLPRRKDTFGEFFNK